MKEYPSRFEEHSSYGSALRLLDRSGATEGVVLDLGCGRSPLAEPLAARGLTYVGCDIDRAALADLTERGAETHELSLATSERTLLGKLRTILDGRPLRAVLALDVLEHLMVPGAVLGAVRTLVESSPHGADLVVSIPNVTHADLGAKLLLGRWDLAETGLLDDTHVRFFSERELERMLAAAGWAVADVDDVVLPLSDQAFPTDAAALRPGAPLRELLRSVRGAVDENGEVYQFVRRLTVSQPQAIPYRHEVDENRPLLSVVIVAAGDAERRAAEALLSDLRSQSSPVDDVAVVGSDDVAGALRRAAGRWVALLGARTRLHPGWRATIEACADEAAGRVIRVGVVTAGDEEVDQLGSTPDAVAGRLDGHRSIELEAFDPLHAAPPLPAPTDAYLVPLEAVLVSGLVPWPIRPFDAQQAAWIARVAQQSGLWPLPDVRVLVPASELTAPTVVDQQVNEALDLVPTVLPVGSISRLAELRHRVVTAEAAVGGADHRAAQAEHKAAVMADQLRRLDHDRAAEHEELVRLRAEHARRPSRRLLRFLRRRTGGPA